MPNFMRATLATRRGAYAAPVGAVLDLADKLWRGEASVKSVHPVSGANLGTIEEVADGVAFVPSFANVSAFATGDGLVLVDTGSKPLARSVHEQVRAWSRLPLHTAVYSHGHVDHVFGVPVFEEEAAANGWRAPRVVAHEALPARFDRYVLTAGHNAAINARQFQLPSFRWPVDYRYPDETYRDRLDLEVGGVPFALHHARGETDDHTWTWIADRKVLCCGDLFIWASPNAGNPQKVQRYPREWAAALRQMVALTPAAEVLLPGHGYPIVGADRIAQALGDTAALLESLHDQTVALMNEGASLDDVVHTVRAPDALLAKPYLQPVYDEPEFVVRNVWRLYGGWHDGNPARLKPPRDVAVAREVAALAGGAGALAARATEVSDAGDHRLACQLAEWAWLATGAGEDAAVASVRAAVYRARLAEETSTMAKGVFASAAKEAEDAGAERAGP
jgi:alkyl sulfatase BDS1-like metallo-beta-lactamase superfamily hydrolase